MDTSIRQGLYQVSSERKWYCLGASSDETPTSTEGPLPCLLTKPSVVSLAELPSLGPKTKNGLALSLESVQTPTKADSRGASSQNSPLTVEVGTKTSCSCRPRPFLARKPPRRPFRADRAEGGRVEQLPKAHHRQPRASFDRAGADAPASHASNRRSVLADPFWSVVLVKDLLRRMCVCVFCRTFFLEHPCMEWNGTTVYCTWPKTASPPNDKTKSRPYGPSVCHCK